jgi:hypothetical protein
LLAALHVIIHWIDVLYASVFGTAFCRFAESGGRGWGPAAAVIACGVAH